MIGRRRLVGVLSVIALGFLLAIRPAAAGSANPAVEAQRVEYAAAEARRTVAVLDGLSQVLEDAIGDARTGSALIVARSDPAGPPLEAAADTLESGSGRGSDAIEAVAALAATLQSARPDMSPPQLTLAPAELLGIASQLRQSAEAAVPFVERRLAAQATLESLATAIVALTANRPDDATAAIASAREARDTVAAWREPPPELAVWLNTTGAMLSAGQQIADALAAGDAAAAHAAGQAYRLAAEQAAVADRALALSIAEVGSGITNTPLRRLARASQAIDDARAMAESIAGALEG